MCVCVKVTQSCPTLLPQGLYTPWNPPGQNTGVCSPSPLQGILSTQGLNPGLLHCRQILYHLSQKGKPTREAPSKRKLITKVRAETNKIKNKMYLVKVSKTKIYESLTQWFLTKGLSTHPRGHLSMTGDSFDWHKWRGCSCYRCVVSKGWMMLLISSVRRTTPHNKESFSPKC